MANANALNAQNNIQSGITLQKQSAGKLLMQYLLTFFFSRNFGIILSIYIFFTEGLMSLLRELGMAYQHLSQFKCTEAIEILNIVPPQHYHTGWVLSMLARAYFEMMNYKKAAR